MLPTGYGLRAWPIVCELSRVTITKHGVKMPLFELCPPPGRVYGETGENPAVKGVAAGYYARQDKDTDENIAAGQFYITYGSPETFVGNDRWRVIRQMPTFWDRLVGNARWHRQ